MIEFKSNNKSLLRRYQPITSPHTIRFIPFWVIRRRQSHFIQVLPILTIIIYSNSIVISKYNMESRDVLKIHGKLRRYCTSSVERSETREVQYLLNAPCIFNTSRDSMVYLYYLFIEHLYWLLHILLYIFTVRCIFQYTHSWMYFF